MKESTKETLITFALVIAVGFMCGFFGFLGGMEKGRGDCVKTLMSIEERLDSLVTTIYPKWEWNPETKRWEKIK